MLLESADLFNAVAFQGKQVLKPEMLREIARLIPDYPMNLVQICESDK